MDTGMRWSHFILKVHVRGQSREASRDLVWRDGVHDPDSLLDHQHGQSGTVAIVQYNFRTRTRTNTRV